MWFDMCTGFDSLVYEIISLLLILASSLDSTCAIICWSFIFLFSSQEIAYVFKYELVCI